MDMECVQKEVLIYIFELLEEEGMLTKEETNRAKQMIYQETY